MAYESGQGIVFNLDSVAVQNGDVDQLLERLFHEAGHAWVSGQLAGEVTFPDGSGQRDKDALSGPLFQGPDADADYSLYRVQPQERHSQMLESLSKAKDKKTGQEIPFSRYWGMPGEVTRGAKNGAKK